MNPNVIRQTVCDYLIQEASLPKEGLASDDHDLIAEGILDSFGLLGLIAHLEQALKLQIDASDIDPAHFNTVTKIVQTVLGQQNSKI
jgi:acyl carrier protein